MANWKQVLQPPAGALPGNLVTKAGVGVIAVLLAGLVLSQSGGDPETEDATAGAPEVSGPGVVGQLRSRLTQLQEQQQVEEARRLRTAAAAAVGTSAALPPGAEPPAGAAGPDEGQVLRSAGEVELRERLRLEALERRTRSLRAPSVVQTVRSDEAGGAEADPPDPADREVRNRTPAVRGGGAVGAGEAGSLPAPPDPAAIAAQMQEANAALLSGLGNGAAAGAEARARTVPGVSGPPVGPTGDPVTVTSPADPAGWERVYEGSVLSAVLITQLSGDFTGPVLAQVSIPFYAADRQRILIPRGTRLLGTAQAVEQQDQGRLAVGFHRLVWPDGRWVDLAFHGLSAVGESALGDRVDRHYVSMFAAAGAVGVLAGLTLQGADPYAGGAAGFRAGAGQGVGQSATQMLGRFLNRLPTVTIRAGHRLRVWVTSDFLAPRPAPHPERMYR